VKSCRHNKKSVTTVTKYITQVKQVEFTRVNMPGIPRECKLVYKFVNELSLYTWCKVAVNSCEQL